MSCAIGVLCVYNCDALNSSFVVYLQIQSIPRDRQGSRKKKVGG